MKYISTRGKDFASSIDDVLKKGIADDGGLFLPESLPIFKEKDFNDSKSIIDTAKILSLMIGNNIKSSDEAIKKSSENKISEKSKIICIPSTAGTGAEITPFSTIWDKKNGRKYSILANKINREIILDPEISISLPEEITISTGLDSLCQILESTWSKKANKKSLSAASLGFEYLNKNLNYVISNPSDIESRQDMLFASFLSGVSISISNTTLCHSISYPLTSILNQSLRSRKDEIKY